MTVQIKYFTIYHFNDLKISIQLTYKCLRTVNTQSQRTTHCNLMCGIYSADNYILLLHFARIYLKIDLKDYIF